MVGSSQLIMAQNKHMAEPWFVQVLMDSAYRSVLVWMVFRNYSFLEACRKSISICISEYEVWECAVDNENRELLFKSWYIIDSLFLTAHIQYIQFIYIQRYNINHRTDKTQDPPPAVLWSPPPPIPPFFILFLLLIYELVISILSFYIYLWDFCNAWRN